MGHKSNSGTHAQAAQFKVPAASLLLQRKCDCGNHTMRGACDDCARKKSPLQRKSAEGFESSDVPSIVHDVLRSPGQPLDLTTRAFFEPRFGHDFSHLRVHTDARAAESAAAVNASAYTVGQDIVFGAGQYEPQTNEGQRLLAHELTHVVQQHQGASKASGNHGSDAPYEAEANQVAENLSQGGTVRVTLGTGPRLSRSPLREWGGFRIDGDDAYVNSVRDDLDRLNGTTTGAATLRAITDYTSPWYRSYIPIRPSSACGFLPTAGNAIVFYNVSGCGVQNNCSGPRTDWNTVANYVYLYHEVAHAYVYYIADQGSHAQRECMVTGLGDYFTTTPHNENRLRCELGLPVRPCYDGECPLPAPTCPRATAPQQQQPRGAIEATMNRPYVRRA